LYFFFTIERCRLGRVKSKLWVAGSKKTRNASQMKGTRLVHCCWNSAWASWGR